MTTIAQLLREKGQAVFSIGPDETVYNALQKMAEANVGCLVVLADGKLVGIVSERDYARNVVLKGRASPTTHVREIMNTAVLYAKPDQTVEECMAVMTDRRVRHLPVVDQGQLIGVISIGDLVKSIISDQKFIIDQLEHFIQGQPF
jgi:CBS domain-containing protein